MRSAPTALARTYGRGDVSACCACRWNVTVVRDMWEAFPRSHFEAFVSALDPDVGSDETNPPDRDDAIR